MFTFTQSTLDNYARVSLEHYKLPHDKLYESRASVRVDLVTNRYSAVHYFVEYKAVSLQRQSNSRPELQDKLWKPYLQLLFTVFLSPTTKR